MLRVSTPLLMIMIATLTTGAQHRVVPKDDFLLSFSTNKLTLSRGTSGVLEIEIIKSRRYSKSIAITGMSSLLPKGVTIVFTPDKGLISSSVVTLSVQPDAEPGEYTLVPNVTLDNKTKGKTLKLIIQ